MASAMRGFDGVLAAARAAPHRKLVRLGERLDAQRLRYLLCLSDRTVPLTTNQVERDLRGAIPVRKLSFGTRNMTGSVQWSDGATLTQTLKKQGRTLKGYVPRLLVAHARGDRLPSPFA